MRSKQSGFSLIELILVLSAMSGLAVVSMLGEKSELEVNMARESGSLLFQYNNAARSWLSNNIDSPEITRNGTSWLKHTSCSGGTSDIPYLPCNFPEASVSSPLHFGNLSLTSRVTSSGVAPNTLTTITTTTSPFTINGTVRSDLSGVATIIAAAGQEPINSPMLLATGALYKSEVTTGIITMTASNAPSNDTWLRTDGSNSMNANIHFDPTIPTNMREIRGVSRLQSTGIAPLYLGFFGGADAPDPARVIVDADQEIMGALTITNIQNKPNGLVVSSGNISLESGSIYASDNIRSGGNIEGNQFVDTTNPAYYLNPSSTSNIGSLYATNNLQAGSEISAPIFFDSNNRGYYVDPSWMSNLNMLTVQNRARFVEHIQLDGVAGEGADCGPNGVVGRDWQGKLMSCVNGIWTSPGGVPNCTVCLMLHITNDGRRFQTCDNNITDSSWSPEMWVGDGTRWNRNMSIRMICN